MDTLIASIFSFISLVCPACETVFVVIVPTSSRVCSTAAVILENIVRKLLDISVSRSDVWLIFKTSLASEVTVLCTLRNIAPSSSSLSDILRIFSSTTPPFEVCPTSLITCWNISYANLIIAPISPAATKIPASISIIAINVLIMPFSNNFSTTICHTQRTTKRVPAAITSLLRKSFLFMSSMFFPPNFFR